MQCFVNDYSLFILVTGEANFSMSRTNLSVEGFSQPPVSRVMIESPGNDEKGVSQRFLWLFPELGYGMFRFLEPVDKEFTASIGMIGLYRKNNYCKINC